MAELQSGTGATSAGASLPLDHQIVIGFGKHKEDNAPVDRAITVGDLCKILKPNKEGEKDGPYFMMGSLKGRRRAAKNMEQMALLMLDIENGDDEAYIVGQIEAAGLLAIVYPTHSHLITSFEINEDTFDRYRKALNGTGGDDAAVASTTCAQRLNGATG